MLVSLNLYKSVDLLFFHKLVKKRDLIWFGESWAWESTDGNHSYIFYAVDVELENKPIIGRYLVIKINPHQVDQFFNKIIGMKDLIDSGINYYLADIRLDLDQIIDIVELSKSDIPPDYLFQNDYYYKDQ